MSLTTERTTRGSFAIAATFILGTIGRYLRPDLYSALWGYQAGGQFGQAVASLTFLNQIWFLNIAPGSNLSYWSLGYEVWYYVIFGLLIFLPDRWNLFAVFLGLALVGPAVAALFSVWLIGLATYKICVSHLLREKSLAGWLLFFGSMAIWWALHMVFARYRVLPSIFLRRIDLAQDYSTALLFSAQLIGFHAISPAVEGQFARARTAIRWAAGATFTLSWSIFPSPSCLRQPAHGPLHPRRIEFWFSAEPWSRFSLSLMSRSARRKAGVPQSRGFFDLVPRYIRI